MPPMHPVTQQAITKVSDVVPFIVGSAMTFGTWGLSEIATGVSIVVGLFTILYLTSMIWLNISKARMLRLTGSTKAPLSCDDDQYSRNK